MKWEIGEVPPGWNRGDPLQVAPCYKATNGKTGRQGYVSQGFDAVPLGGDIVNNCLYEFDVDDVPKVTAWVKWWKSHA